MNDFKTDLEYSLDSSLESFWDAIYKKAFVDLSYTEICTNKDWQKRGVDRFVHLTSGRIFAVDEKCRRKVYSDIALEIVSNTATDAPGWMEKDLCIDFLAYAFMPQERVYLFSWPMLRRAWLNYRDSWKSKYGTISAPNRGYNTISVPVPIEVLRGAVKSVEMIQL